ncbi:uncharacterized protein C6orf132 homolog [Sorex fumeus]|uniref:uncharacterized protein C6orf132 homolog n=1 Tax=Sorex fumeus TaxID=62283 RepID=UPI0024ADDAF6|nr:uncharacterized protein C6orf132 homolog [Sorex fumeus]
MRKSPTVQGTFSKLFGRKHASPAGGTSLYATNPPWIFAQEAPDEGPRGFDGIYYGDGRFNTVSECGTATLKARPRVRPLLTFLPLNAQENHGLAVPTPSVPEDFADKEVTGSLVNGNLRLYSSVGDLRPGHYGLDPLIPPPPPGPAPRPPVDLEGSPPPGGESPPPPPPPSTAPPPPPLFLEPPSPPGAAPPTPPALGALSPSPSTPTPPDFIPPAPPLAIPAPPPLPAPAPPSPAVSPHAAAGTRPFPPGGVTKWKSEVALNGRQPEGPGASPPRSPAEPRGSPKPDPHLTFPRSLKVPPPTPVRTSSIPVPETQESPPEEEEGEAAVTKQAPSRLPLPPSFHVRPAAHASSDSAPESRGSRESSEPRAADPDPASPRKGEPPAPPPPPPPPAPPAPAPRAPAPRGGPRTPPEDPQIQLPRPQAAAQAAAPAPAPQPGERAGGPGRGLVGPRADGEAAQRAVRLPVRARPAAGAPQGPPSSKDGASPGPAAAAAAAGEGGQPRPGPAPRGLRAPGPPDAQRDAQRAADQERAGGAAVLGPGRAGRQARPGRAAPQAAAGRGPEPRTQAGPAGPRRDPRGPPARLLRPEPRPPPSTPPWRAAEKTPGSAAGRWKKPALLDAPAEAQGRRPPAALPPKKSAGPPDSPRRPPLAAEPPAPQDDALRHPVTGEAVERGSPMALLLAARQRAQKGRPGGSAPGRSSLPGSLRGPGGGQPDAPDSIFYSQGRPNSFTVVPRPSAPCQPPARRDADGGWTQERPAPARGPPPPRSFSSPPSPSRTGGDSDGDGDDEAAAFGFGLIPPPPEFCSEPEPPGPPAPQSRLGRGSPPRPGGLAPLSGRAGARERGSGTGRSLIKKRLYVGEPPRPAPPSRGPSARSLSTPNCFGPPPAGPEMRRVHSAGRAAPPGGLHARRMSLEGAARGEPRAQAVGAGDLGYGGPARTVHGAPHYGGPINTFTVRPGTRHPISYGYSGTHRKSMS